MVRLTTSEYGQKPGSCYSDGQTLAIVDGDDIAMLDVSSGRKTPFLNLPNSVRSPEFSPDGRWIAYVSGTGGRLEVWVQPFPSSSRKVQISTEGGTEPLWSPNSKELFYRLPDQIWAVDVQTEAGFSPSKPRKLFENSGYGIAPASRNWDISPNGQRFLMVKLDTKLPPPITEMVLVQNWFEELKRLVPTGKK